MGTAEIVTAVVLLMLVAALVRGGAEKLGVPVSVLLFVTGLLLSALGELSPGALGAVSELSISSELVLFVFLPTLIFESAMHFEVSSLRRNLGPILLLAIPGLLLSTLAVGLLVSWVSSIAFTTALLLGAILSATDPVAVLSIFQKLGAPKRLNTLVEGESLFNDATSLVLSKILAAAVVGGVMNFTDYVAGVGSFFYVFLGGAAVGAVLGFLALLLLSFFSTDSPITITVTTILAYLSFLTAEHLLGVSGVIATLGAGLLFGARGWIKLPKGVRNYVEQFWSYVAFLANALLFLLMGMQIDLATLISARWILLTLVLAMLLARGLVVFGLLPVHDLLRPSESIAGSYKLVLLWGGLRGAVPIAIVLGLPETVGNPLLVSLVFGAVLFTLLVHGLTIEPLVRLLRLDRGLLSQRLLETEAQLQAKEDALRRVPELTENGVFSPRIGRELEREYRGATESLREELRAIEKESEEVGFIDNLIMLLSLNVELAFYRQLLDNGHLGEHAYRQLKRQTEAQAEKVGRRGDVHDVRYGFLHPKTVEEFCRGVLWKISRFRAAAEGWRRKRLAIDYEVAWGHFEASREVLRRLESIADAGIFPASAIEAATGQYRHWNVKAREYLEETAREFPEFVSATQETLGRRLALLTEEQSLQGQGERGFIPAHVMDRLLEDLHRELWGNRVAERAEFEVDPTRLLRSVPLFRELPEEEIGALARTLRSELVNQGDRVVEQGEPGSSLYLIARGAVRVIREPNGGGEPSAGEPGAGEPGAEEPGTEEPGGGEPSAGEPDAEEPDAEAPGSREPIATLMPGDFFGEMALIRGGRRSATVEAFSNTLLYELGRETLHSLFDRYPSIRTVVEEADRERRAGDFTPGKQEQ